MGIVKKACKPLIQEIRKFRNWRGIVWKAPNDFNIPFRTKLRYALKGFKPNEYVWFDLAHNDYKDYISDYERLLSREMNGQCKVILDDKLLFEEIFRNYVRVPAIYAWISEGHIYGLHGYKI